LKQIPIKDSPTSEQDKIIQLVEKILERKMSNPDVDITAIEKDIDEAVYHIFNLTEQERILIENGG
jgi:molybdopterin biosynthesis enzyme MoaB